MKKGLFIGLISLVLAGIMVFSLTKENDSIKDKEGGASMTGAKSYLISIRNNQETGLLNPQDVLKAREQLSTLKGYDELDWQSIGPDNIAGRVRALLFDNQDNTAQTLYAGGVNGGLFKTTNLGIQWESVSTGDKTLNISSMYQTSSGTIYIGTGEGLYSSEFSGTGDYGIETGFVGQGIFEYSASGDLSLVAGTEPTTNNTDFAYVNEIMEVGGNLVVATHAGLKVRSGGSWAFAKTSAGDELTGIAWDIKVGSNGAIFASVNGESYRSADGNTNHFELISGGDSDLPSGSGRVEFAVASNDANIVFANVSKITGRSDGVYKSTDGGLNWFVILPGGSATYNLFSYKSGTYQGNYDNMITVFPNDDSRILVGGLNLWLGESIPGTEYYDWTKISDGVVENFYLPWYLHYDIHSVVFQPNSNSNAFVSTDGGVYYTNTGSSEHTYQARNNGLATTQYYKVGIGTKKDVILGGTQDNGTQYVYKNFQGKYLGENIFLNGVASDGGYSILSMMDSKFGSTVTDPASLYFSADKHNLFQPSTYGYRMYRSETLGQDFSVNFFDSIGSFVDYGLNFNTFLTPILLSENFNDLNTGLFIDSVKINKDYEAGDTAILYSKSFRYPFEYIMPTAVDSNNYIYNVPDVVVPRLFLAVQNQVFMTFDALNFAKAPYWYRISASDSAGVSGNPTSIAYSTDGYLFVGTQEGELYRIDNINNAYTLAESSIDTNTCILSTSKLTFPNENGQTVTSVSVDPNDANNVLVTLGNYGNDTYLYYSTDALSSEPTFTSVQGNLAAMPVYASVLEMGSDNTAIIGTENGLYTTDNIDAASVNWTPSGANIGMVPVFDIVQQTNKKEAFIIQKPNPGIPGQYINDVYSAAANYGSIYVATYGRGLFRDDTYWEPVGVKEFAIENPIKAITLFPNPVANQATVNFELENSSTVQVNVYDLSGKLVYANTNKYPKGNAQLTYNVNSLKNGTYIVQLVAEGKSNTTKMVVFH